MFRPIALSLLLFFAGRTPALADAKLTLHTTTEPFEALGQTRPRSEGQITVWVGKKTVRLDRGEVSTLLDEAAGKLYFVDHTKHEYSIVPLPADLQTLVDEETRSWMEKMRPMMKMAATVTPADDERTIGGWPCRRHAIQVVSTAGLRLDMDLWTTKAIDLDLRAWARLQHTLAALQPTGADWVDAILAIEGVPVLRATAMVVEGATIHTKEELASVERVDAPAGSYAPPAGYAAVPFRLEQAQPLVRP